MAEQKKGPGRPKGSSNKKTAAKKAPPKAEQKPEKDPVRSEIAGIVIAAFGIFFAIAMQTKIAGPVGRIISNALKGCFGLGAFFLPYFLILFGILMVFGITRKFRPSTLVWMLVLYLSLDLFNAGRFVKEMDYGLLGFKEVYEKGVALENGGLFGMYAGGGLFKVVGMAGLYIVAAVLLLISLLVLTRTPLGKGLDRAKERREKRKERREEQRAIEEQEARRRREIEAEFAEKRRAVDETGRQMEMNYKSPSERAAIFTEPEQKKKEPKRFKRNTDQAPKLRSREWKRLSDNQKNILDLVYSENFHTGTDVPEGYGLTPGDGSSLRQPRRKIVSARETFHESLFNEDIPLEDVAPEETDFVGFPEQETPEPITEVKTVEKPAVEIHSHPKREGDGPAIGGASVATAASATEDRESTVKVTPKRRGTYTMPFMNLLDETKNKARTQNRKELHDKAELLETTLASFGVDATVTNVISGPSVTRYEIEPARGVKVSSITKLSDDLALNMRAKSIRIEAPIPGKAAVGIEIENEDRQMIGLKEIIQSPAFREHKSKLAFAVGKDIGGNAVVADLAKMPHMLIAGATGSGKSVCINAIIMSLLYKANPYEVKMLLIDPKMVELGNYNGIPHLMHPVVTDANKAAAALQWAVAEMTERYKKFAKAGVKDLGSYNSKMQSQGESDEIMPQIVIIIDELADLMMVASAQVEEAICRLAQLARAAGMHMILATQRPSVDVITGLIKANVPSRIAFMVSSQVDSRTIIDMAGAEKLVGNGDMLFKPQDLNKPKRIQGPFVSDTEIERVLTHVRNQHIDPDYNEAITEVKTDSGGGFSSDGPDELMEDVMEYAVTQGQISISLLQRRFRVGYNRAARMVDYMEEQGIIGPPDGTKPRQVIIDEAEWKRRKAEQ